MVTKISAGDNAKKLNALSVKLGKTAKSLDKEIHEHMLNIGDHIAAYGDVTTASYLVDQLKEGSIRTNAIRQWFLTFGGCGWNANKKSFTKTRDQDFRWDRKTADENPFWIYQPEPEFKPLDGFAMLKSFVSRVGKLQKVGFVTDREGNLVKGKDGKPIPHKNMDKAMVDDLMALLKKYDATAAVEASKAIVEQPKAGEVKAKEQRMRPSPKPQSPKGEQAPAAVH